jgi:hypothetical protein
MNYHSNLTRHEIVTDLGEARSNIIIKYASDF